MLDRRTTVRRDSERQRHEGERRRVRLSEVVVEAREEKRSHQRRLEKDRRINSARALHVSNLVYDAYLRGHGEVPAR